MQKRLINPIKAILLFGFILTVLYGCGSVQSELPYNNTAQASKKQTVEITQEVLNFSRPNYINGMYSISYDMKTILESEGFDAIIRYNDGRYYAVQPVRGGKYLFILFSSQNNSDYIFSDGYLAFSFADKNRFKDIAAGMTKEVVLARDPSAWFDEKTSFHRFSDGTVLVVEYKSDSSGTPIVSEYSYCNTEENVVNYLLPCDRELLEEN